MRINVHHNIGEFNQFAWELIKSNWPLSPNTKYNYEPQ